MKIAIILCCIRLGNVPIELNAKLCDQDNFPVELSSILESDVLPHYRQYFPSNPSYVDISTGQQKTHDNPFWGYGIHSYHDYLDRISRKEISQRNIHGVLHATRTAIWTQLFIELHELANKEWTYHRLFLALAGAAHDIARQDEGEDFWDFDSALWVKNYLSQQNLEKKQVDLYFNAISQKDPENRNFVSPEQQAIHDADVLEFHRELDNPMDFIKEELCFYHFDQLDVKFKEELIDEIQLFIYLSETKEIKNYLNEYSRDSLGDLLCLMQTLHDNFNCFPHLTELLKCLIKPFKTQVSILFPLIRNISHKI